jgi:4-amino-4-deoxy-L-arabinose transferase-like glycosyltransferase
MGAAGKSVWGGLGLAVLLLAALNIAFRIGRESVQLWDEALYGLSALDMLTSGDWVHTTILGATDYYNAKPPLNVWLIALSFKAFGVTVTSLRLPSMVAAWSTIALLLWWLSRTAGPAVGRMAALVLATCYGFLYVHSGREGNTDAIFVLLILLTALTLWAAVDRPWRRLWLGPILAAVFLLRGMAFVMPLLIVVVAEVTTRRSRRARWIPLAAAALAFVVLIAPWVVARWQVDRWTFLGQLFLQDFVARTTSPLDAHHGSVLFYVHQLQKNHYDWLIAALVASLCIPWRSMDTTAVSGRWSRPLVVLFVSWGVVAVVMPTVVATKVAWYLNPFYPVFATAVAWLITTGWRLTHQSHPRRAIAIVATTALTLIVAESRLIWQSYVNRDIADSKQGQLLAHAGDIKGRTVYAPSWDLADAFVVLAVGGELGTATSGDEFLRISAAGDFWLDASRQLRSSGRGARASYVLITRDENDTVDTRRVATPCADNSGIAQPCE